jgi:hypothetical protein
VPEPGGYGRDVDSWELHETAVRVRNEDQRGPQAVRELP